MILLSISVKVLLKDPHRWAREPVEARLSRLKNPVKKLFVFSPFMSQRYSNFAALWASSIVCGLCRTLICNIRTL